MRKANPASELPAEQAAVADSGVKAMIPIGRPFLDYVLSALADAGFTDACLVIGPEHGRVRDYYTREITPSRIRVDFAIQQEPLGTADAVVAAEEFCDSEPFVALNSDNYYPTAALEALHELREPSIVGFDREILVSLGNVPADRTARFGALDVDSEGNLRKILLKPTDDMVRARDPIYSSMNCFLFTQQIFRACREVPISASGEYELPQAVHRAIGRGEMQFKVVRIAAPVLDLSTRADIALVAERLKGVDVRL